MWAGMKICLGMRGMCFLVVREGMCVFLTGCIAGSITGSS